MTIPCLSAWFVSYFVFGLSLYIVLYNTNGPYHFFTTIVKLFRGTDMVGI